MPYIPTTMTITMLLARPWHSVCYYHLSHCQDRPGLMYDYDGIIAFPLPFTVSGERNTASIASCSHHKQPPPRRPGGEPRIRESKSMNLSPFRMVCFGRLRLWVISASERCEEGYGTSGEVSRGRSQEPRRTRVMNICSWRFTRTTHTKSWRTG